VATALPVLLDPPLLLQLPHLGRMINFYFIVNVHNTVSMQTVCRTELIIVVSHLVHLNV